MEDFEVIVRRGGATAVRHASRFFFKDDRLWSFVRTIATQCETIGHPYAISGDIALVFHGHFRTQGRVEVLLQADAKSLFRDGRFQIKNDTVVDPKSMMQARMVHQPLKDGSTCLIDGIRVATIHELIEQRLGKSRPSSMDLSDSVELIKARGLTAEFGSNLSDHARRWFLQLCIELETCKNIRSPDKEN